MRLGEAIVGQFYGEKEAKRAKANFEKTFSQGQTPEVVEEYILGKNTKYLAEILAEMNLVSSTREFLRLLQQGAISHEGVKLNDPHWVPKPGILKIGKRRFLKLG